jgi:type IV secretory pathway VirB10-like protein
MPRISKRLIAACGVSAAAVAGGVVLTRRRSAATTATAPTPPAPASPPPAAASAASTPPVAPPPPETPGPSVTPPGREQGSETERAERAEATVPDSEVLRGRPRHVDDDYVAQEEAAAAAEARAIGGPGVDDAHGDPAWEAVYEAGGGEAEGFELSEEELIENATHGDGHAEPLSDAFTPELEADEVTAVDGEPDQERVSELEDDDR